MARRTHAHRRAPCFDCSAKNNIALPYEPLHYPCADGLLRCSHRAPADTNLMPRGTTQESPLERVRCPPSCPPPLCPALSWQSRGEKKGGVQAGGCTSQAGGCTSQAGGCTSRLQPDRDGLAIQFNSTESSVHRPWRWRTRTRCYCCWSVWACKCMTCKPQPTPRTNGF